MLFNSMIHEKSYHNLNISFIKKKFFKEELQVLHGCLQLMS